MSATLQIVFREKKGTRATRKLRAAGKIPASIQGEGKENLDVAIVEDDFLAARRHHEHLFDLELEGGETETALVGELQWDAFGDRILHVEFRRVVRTRETTADVELEFIGHPKGGILNHLMTHVAIRALPANIPDRIEVRVGELSIGHPLLARDIVLPEGVTLAIPGETPVAFVVIPRGEEELAKPEAAPAAEAPAAPAAPPAEEKGPRA